MRAALVALGALGCAGDKAADSAHGHGSGEDSGGGLLPLEQQVWQNPAEAEDLAPEEGLYRVQLRAAPHSFELLDWQGGERIPVEGLAYNNQIPGPTLRVQVGDVVEVELVNAIEEWTTIHWHGIELDNAMDGVPELQDPVNPRDTFTYRFTATRAGTYWYHPHFNVMEQVSAGLFGALIVEDPADPPADRELVGVLQDWGGSTLGSEHLHGAHGDEGLWTVNSQVVPALELSGGERLRMRLINASGAGYVRLSGEVLGEEVEGAELIATDQGLLAAAEPLSELLLTPGDRGELLLRPGEQAPILLDWPWSVFGGEAHGDPVALFSTGLTAPAPAGEALDLPFDGGGVSEDPGYTDITYVLQGDPHTDTWMINGEVYPEVTAEQLRLGRPAIIEVRNLSATEHPFHMHGMAFELLSVDGLAVGARRMEDTVNLRMQQVLRLRVVPPNPGQWMVHCHVLSHEHNGMMTFVEVTED